MGGLNDLFINMRFFSFWYNIKKFTKWFTLVALFLFYFSYVFFRLFTSLHGWLIS